MSLSVRFWGTRGSIATPGAATRRYGGNTSCVEIRTDGTTFVCDTGTGARELGLDLVQRGSRPLHLHMLFSHAHWDHIQGFPFFEPAYLADSTLYLYQVAAADIDFFRLLCGQMESPYCPVEFADLSGGSSPACCGRGTISSTASRCATVNSLTPARALPTGSTAAAAATSMRPTANSIWCWSTRTRRSVTCPLCGKCRSTWSTSPVAPTC